jgi:peptidyl-prolyl cis-trans isomerase C
VRTPPPSTAPVSSGPPSCRSRSRRARRGAAVLLAAALLLASRTPRAQGDAASASADAHRAAIAAHIGPRAVTVGELEDRLAPVPRFQLRGFGATPDVIRRRFFEQVIVRDALLTLGAEERHLDQDIANEQASYRVLSTATLSAIRAAAGAPGAVPMDEVQRFYEANIDRFVTGDRISIWRILCKTQGDAQTVLEAAKKAGTLQTFTQLARENSIDSATFLRGGNLGFVDPKGVSNEPGLVVDTALVAAARGVKDGEFVPAPVPEGKHFAVVWRRGSIAGTRRTVDEVKGQIQDSIVRQRREVAEKALIDRLRAEKVKDVNEALLGTFDVSISDGVVTRKRVEGKPGH